MKIKNKIILIVLFMFFLFSNISQGVIIQQHPITQTNGLVIESPIFNQIHKDQDNIFYWNVYNLSTGLYMQQNEVFCSFRVVSRTQEIISFNNVFNNISLNSTVFSEVGTYSRLIQCNSTDGYGDFNELTFNVVNNLNEFEEDGRSWLPIVILYIFVTLMFGLASFMIKSRENTQIKHLFFLLFIVNIFLMASIPYFITLNPSVTNSFNTVTLSYMLINVLLLIYFIYLTGWGMITNMFTKMNKKEND